MELYNVDTDESFNDLKAMLQNKEAILKSLEGSLGVVRIGNTTINVNISPKYLDSLTNVSPHNKLVYGKNPTSNIFNISEKDGSLYIFKTDGTIDKLNYKPWALSHTKHPGFRTLKGSEWFNHIKEYDSIASFKEVSRNFYKLGVFSYRSIEENFMVREGYTYFKNTKPEDLSILSFDIETKTLDPAAKGAKVLLITNTFRNKGVSTCKVFNCEDYKSDVDMILDWTKWVNDVNPMAIIGHNIVIFDIPYLVSRLATKGYSLNLGVNAEPINIEESVKELRVDGTQTYSYNRISIFGREIVDTFFLAIKGDVLKKYDSYKLKEMIKQAGLEKSGRQHYDGSLIAKNWDIPEERAKIIKYAEDDSEDPLKIFDMMITSFFYLAQSVPKSLQSMIESATGGQINSMMVRSYLQDDFSVAKAEEIPSFEGAISFGNPGIYSDVLKVDVKSLYPSIMLQYNIRPEGKDYNDNFLKMLKYFTDERLKNKELAESTGDKYYSGLEQAQKVFINSAYGFMGASGLNYNYGKGASEVTKYGREIINKSIEWATGCKAIKVVDHIVNEGKPNEEKEYKWIIDTTTVKGGKGFTVSNCDTDSISFTTGKYLSKEERAALIANLNKEYPKNIIFADDGYYTKLIVLKAKNYIMLKENGEVKLKGSSLKDKKKEPALKEMLSNMINSLLFNKETPNKIYIEYIKEALAPSDISRWASRKSISKKILECSTNPESRLNERNVYDAIKDIHVQEGDKIYLYPAILASEEITTTYKNGNVKTKVIKTTGLKRVDVWNGDHDVDKLIERVYSTVEILSPVLNMDEFIDYTKVKNKPLLSDIFLDTNDII